MFTEMRDGSLALAPQGGARRAAVADVAGDRQRQPAASSSGSAVDRTPFSPLRFAQSNGNCQELDQHCYRLVVARQTRPELGGRPLLAERPPPPARRDGAGLLRRRPLQPAREPVSGAGRRAAGVAARRRTEDHAQSARPHRVRLRGRRRWRGLRHRAESGREPCALPGDLARYGFQSTSTGVFIALHHLEQGLDPARVGATDRSPPTSTGSS